MSGLLHTGDENDWSDLGLDGGGGGGGGGGTGSGGHSNGSNGGTHHISRDFLNLF